MILKFKELINHRQIETSKHHEFLAQPQQKQPEFEKQLRFYTLEDTYVYKQEVEA